MEVLCLPASGCDLELYTAELLYRHRPIEAPVSPRKCTLKNQKAGGRRFTSLAELQKQKNGQFQCEVLIPHLTCPNKMNTEAENV